ncbi:MAG TPA: flagellar biosynthesis protein FlgM [Planctomycetaceae bacterium]|nr:flagellar biosynthesis protein FlgM [Planctomycetaceae bacterium]
MQIFGPFRVSTTQATSGAQRLQPQASPNTGSSRSATPVDQLDLSSSVSRLDASSNATSGGEIRIDRVAELRRQIASGNYDSPEKMDIALERMLDQFG